MTRSMEVVREDASRVLDVVADGGVAIIPLDVAYGIVGHREPAMRRIFEAKRRSYEKPSGFFGHWDLFSEIHIVGARERDVVRAVIQDNDLPLSVVAPFRADHPLLRPVDPFVLSSSTKEDTLDMLLNAGILHNEITRQSRDRGIAIFGSSANLSLTGSKFRLEDIDPPVRQAAEVALDYGLSRYHNPAGVSSTIVDLRNFQTVRQGVCYDKIRSIILTEFGIDIQSSAAA